MNDQAARSGRGSRVPLRWVNAFRSLIFLLLVVAASSVEARQRIDHVTLKNGDRITGEIIRLQSAALSVRTAKFGTINIDWPDVESLISIQHFEVELVDGRRLSGHLDEGGDPGEIEIRSGEDQWTAPMADVVGIVQLGQTLWGSRRGYLDLGFDYASAEDDTQLSLGVELNVQGRRARWANEFTSVLSSDANTTQRVRALLQSAVEIPINRQWEVIGGAILERNDDLDLDVRLSAAANVVWYPYRSARGRWGLGAGLVEARERYSGEEAANSSLSASLVLTGDYDRFGPFGTNTTGEAVYLPALDGSGRFRVEVRGSIRQKIYNDFTFTVSPYYSYDSKPPRSEFEGEDWGWVSSVGWNF